MPFPLGDVATPAMTWILIRFTSPFSEVLQPALLGFHLIIVLLIQLVWLEENLTMEKSYYI